jgi:hypothetical protein
MQISCEACLHCIIPYVGCRLYCHPHLRSKNEISATIIGVKTRFCK